MVTCNYCGSELVSNYLMKRHQTSEKCLKIQAKLLRDKKDENNTKDDYKNVISQHEIKYNLLQSENKSLQSENKALQKELEWKTDTLQKQIDELKKENKSLRKVTIRNSTINNNIINNIVPLTSEHVEQCKKLLKLKHLEDEDSIARFIHDPGSKNRALRDGNKIGTKNANGEMLYTSKEYHIKKCIKDYNDNIINLIDNRIKHLENKQKELDTGDDNLEQYKNIFNKIRQLEKRKQQLLDIIDGKSTPFKTNIIKIYVDLLDSDNIDTAINDTKMIK